MIKLADERITHIQAELDEYKQSKEILENKLSSFKNQVRFFFLLSYLTFFLLITNGLDLFV